MSAAVTSPFATSLSPSSMTGPIHVARQQGLTNHDEQSAKRAQVPLAARFFPRDRGPCQSSIRTERRAVLDATTATVPYCAAVQPGAARHRSTCGAPDSSPRDDQTDAAA